MVNNQKETRVQKLKTKKITVSLPFTDKECNRNGHNENAANCIFPQMTTAIFPSSYTPMHIFSIDGGDILF